MSDRRSDIQVGLFAMIAVLLLAMLILIFGGFKNVLADTYRVTAHFPNAAGATDGTPVRLLGIDVGRVSGVTLDKAAGGVVITLAIESDVDIRTDSPLSIKQEGFIANLYVEFSAGGSQEHLAKDGTARVEGKVDTFGAYLEKATMTLTEMGGSIKQQMSDVSQGLIELTDNLNEITGDGEFRSDVKALTANASDISAQLKNRLPELMKNLNGAAAKAETSIEKTSKLFDTYQKLGEELTGATTDAREQMARQGANLDELTASLSETSQNISTLALSLNDVAEMVKAGEGSVGRLFTEADLYRSIVSSIDTLSEASSEFRDLARTLKEHPDWVLKGPPKRK